VREAPIISWFDMSMIRDRVVMLLSACAAASLAAHLWAGSRGAHAFVYVFKPLTTTLIFLLAAWMARRAGDAGRPYAKWVIAGLACSIAGDVFLMLPGDWFTQGLAAFLAAHVCYIRAFVSRAGRVRVGPSALPFALAYVVLVARLAPHVGPLIGAVSLYGAVLMAMGWYAVTAWHAVRSTGARAAAIGAVCFIVSDTALAFGRFTGPLPGGEALVMVTYVAAQWLLARSVAQRPPDRTVPCTP
jgi:uncharacterized membrane protein YhhN